MPMLMLKLTMQKILVMCFLVFSIGSFSQSKLDIFFDFNKNVPNKTSLLKIEQWILNTKDSEVTKILGFCDSVDDSQYNKDLAMRRVNSIVELFSKNKVVLADNVELKAFGKDFSYSKNQSENRKVEVFYTLINAVKEKNPLDVKVDKDFQTHQLSKLVAEEKEGLASKFFNAKKGDLIRINNISFYFNSEKVMEQSEPLLNEMLQIMLDNPKLILKIHGHICCNLNPMDTKLSYRRALVIFKYLSKNGIKINRLAFKGYGSNDPIYSLPERNEKERAANRRVEILIIDK